MNFLHRLFPRRRNDQRHHHHQQQQQQQQTLLLDDQPPAAQSHHYESLSVLLLQSGASTTFGDDESYKRALSMDGSSIHSSSTGAIIGRGRRRGTARCHGTFFKKCCSCCFGSGDSSGRSGIKYDSPCAILLGFLGLGLMGTLLGSAIPSFANNSGDDETENENENDSTQSSISSWDTISNILGYTYFLSWTLSFYPQIITNVRYPSRAKRGVSLDFVVWNIVGFACYAVYVTAFRYSEAVRREYADRFGSSGSGSSSSSSSSSDAGDEGDYATREGDINNATTYYGGTAAHMIFNAIFSSISETMIDNYYLQTNNNEIGGYHSNNNDGNHTNIHNSTMDPAGDGNNATDYYGGNNSRNNQTATTFDDHASINNDEPMAVPQVQVNDVAFAWHALILTIVIFVQIAWSSSSSSSDDCEEYGDDDGCETTNHCHARGDIHNGEWLEVEGGEDVRVEELGHSAIVSKEGGLNSEVEGLLDSGLGDENDDDELTRNHTDHSNTFKHSALSADNDEFTATNPTMHHRKQSQQDLNHAHQDTLISRQDKCQPSQQKHNHWTQRISLITRILILVLLLTCFIGALFVATDLDMGIWGGGQWQWIDYLYFLSFVKVGITIVKYIPQVILNFNRKSTSGWQIWNILLDFSGGMLSILQLVGDSMAQARAQGLQNDWTGVIGNPAKFGLGLVSIFFDIIFMFQHYVLYREDTSSRPSHPDECIFLARNDFDRPLLSDDDWFKMSDNQAI